MTPGVTATWAEVELSVGFNLQLRGFDGRRKSDHAVRFALTVLVSGLSNSATLPV